MAVKMSVVVRNAMLNAVEAAIGAAAVLKLRSGAVPANLAAADSGDELAILALPADWLAAADNGSKAKAGVWQGLGAAAGVAGHFRIYAADGATPHIQGTVTPTGGGGDLTLDNPNIGVGQAVTISAFSIGAANG